MAEQACPPVPKDLTEVKNQLPRLSSHHTHTVAPTRVLAKTKRKREWEPAWFLVLVIPTLRRLRQKSEACLGYRVSSRTA